MARPHIRYQVFISSTFVDLKDERRAVASELLADGHIPAGMEDFPATDDRGWKAIKRAIDFCDYYVLLIAGRYGSFDESIGMSWTDREYRYAVEKGRKVLAFIRDAGEIRSNQEEQDEAGRKRHKEFVATVKSKHLVKGWQGKEDLVGKVTQALAHAIRQDEEENTLPPGWVRGDEIPSVATADEIARLSRENAELRKLVAAAPTETAKLELQIGSRSEKERTVEKPYYAPGAFSKWQSNKTASEWLEETYRTLWIPIVLLNAGRIPARNVKVTVLFAVSEYLEIGYHAVPWLPVLPQAAAGADRVASIESIYREHGKVVHRITSVGAYGEEELVRVGVRVPASVVSATGEYTVMFSCRAQDELGAFVAENFTIHVEKAQEQTTCEPTDVLHRESLLLESE